MSSDTQVRPPVDDVPAEPPAGTVERVRPSARCRKCGDGVVVAVCSRCARLQCQVHDSAAGPLGPRALLRLFRTEPDSRTLAVAGKDVRTRGAANNGATGQRAHGRGDKEEATADKDRDGNAAGGDDAKPTGQAEAIRTAAAKGEQAPTAGNARTSKPQRADQRYGGRPRGATQRHYCAGCVPRARPYDAELIAAMTTSGLGGFVLPVQPVLGGLLVGAGVLRCGIRIVQDLRQRTRQSADRSADLVLNPNLRKIKARERIRGTVRLTDDRRYEATVDDVVGSVRVEGNWSRMHRSELDRHRRRTKTEPTTVAAGHVVLHGPARVEFRPVSDAGANGGPALVLEPRVADQEMLVTPDGQGDTRWRPEFRYDISPPDDGWTLPVWLSPNIAADLERHVLELHVHWCTRKADRPHAGVPLRSIEMLELDVPAHWGTIEHMTQLGDDRLTGQPEADDDGFGRRKLTWKKIRYPKEGDRGSVRFAVRFSDAIDIDHELTGRLEARFGGAVSGLTRIGLYRTDGGSVKGLDGANSPLTVVDLKFGLSLKGLRYQQQRTVPNRSRAEDVNRHETQTFPGVVPDHRTIALLTNNLADEGYYVIRVLENPAQPGPRSGAVNRLWDLVGRYYEGVYPIEFHLVLSGEEIHKGQEVTGETTVLLTVAGSYANDVMEQRVVEEWTRLWKRIRLSLQAAGGEPRSVTQPLDAPSSELARLRNVMVTEIGRLTTAAAAGRIDPDVATEIVAGLTHEFGLGEE